MTSFFKRDKGCFEMKPLYFMKYYRKKMGHVLEKTENP